MTTPFKQLIGWLLVASPFIGLAWLCFKTDGWRCFLIVFGGTALVYSVIGLALG